MRVALDKFIARRIVAPDVPVAPAVLLESEADERGLDSLRYPVLVKPNDEGSSIGIREDAIAEDASQAATRARRLRRRYGCPVLVEEFLPGAEVTAAVIGNGAGARLLGLMEIAPAEPDARFVYSIEVKRAWRRRVRYHVPPRLDAPTLAAIDRAARIPRRTSAGPRRRRRDNVR